MTLPLTLRRAVPASTIAHDLGTYDPGLMMRVSPDGSPLINAAGSWSASTITKTGAEGEKSDLDTELE